MRDDFGLVGADGRMEKRPSTQKRRFFEASKTGEIGRLCVKCVLCVLAQVKWLWRQTTTELAPSMGGHISEKRTKIGMCVMGGSSDGPCEQLSETTNGTPKKNRVHLMAQID